MNHKRGQKKDSRSGCLLCKPHKTNAEVGRERQQRKRFVRREVEEELEALDEEWLWETSLANPANNA